MTILATLAFSSSWWAAIGAPIGNHLWQSTLFAGVAGLLTLLLRKNRANTRYSLWLIASAKFLLPFSLMIGIGSHLRWSNRPAMAHPSIFAVTQVISEPFAEVKPGSAAAHASQAPVAALVRTSPTLLLTVWFCGCMAVLFFWWRRRQRLIAAIRRARPSQSGRELETLSRSERGAGMTGRVQVKVSESALAPGVWGIFRPVLVLPFGISERMTDAQLEAIITHELCHVRRRDNLAAGFHMLVEALFWFHPLVWWMGARLVEERERACDEEVLRLGTDPHVYAEGILKVCKFYLESPLSCAAGVTGSNLKKRIEAIMSHRIPGNLASGKKLLLAVAGVVSVAGPVVFGLLHATQIGAQPHAQNAPAGVLAFETVSIKPNKTGEPMPGFTVKGRPMQAIIFRSDKFLATNYTLRGLIRAAYGVQDAQITGGPDWLDSEKFDVNATINSSLTDDLSKLSAEEAGYEKLSMLQTLLADRFKLVIRREARQAAGYALVIAKNGPKLQRAKPGDTYPDGLKDPFEGRPLGPGMWLAGPCKLVGQGVAVSALVRVLAGELKRVVVDKTDIQGNYDFTLDCHTAFMERGESILTVLPEQLGLELNERTLPVEMLVIDHAEQPTGNEDTGTLHPAHGHAALQTQNASISSFPFQAVTIKENKTGELTRAMRFEPDRFMATNVTLYGLIAAAYGAGGSEILGGPDWVRSEHYDIEAKLDTSVIDELGKRGPDERLLEWKRILQALLADRFRLTLHRETREPPAYVLAIAKDGLKLLEAKPGDSYPDGFKDPRGRPLGPGLWLPGPCTLVGQGVHLVDLAKTLSVNYLGGQTVIDQTGLMGVYDFTLDCHTAFMERGASVLTVLPEQLGLELKLLDVLVIDYAEKIT